MAREVERLKRALGSSNQDADRAYLREIDEMVKQMSAEDRQALVDALWSLYITDTQPDLAVDKWPEPDEDDLGFRDWLQRRRRGDGESGTESAH